MRYTTPVTFVATQHYDFDYDSGDYTEGKDVADTRFASVMDTGTETMRLVYGEIRQGSLTVQLQNHYDGDIEYLVIGGRRYVVDYRRRLHLKETFVVSEMQGEQCYG